MPGGDDLEGYAVARWPTLVRTLVLLGAPPGHAAALAARAVARVRDEPAEGWLDADVVVLGEVLAQWREDDSSWWDGAAESLTSLEGTGYDEIEPALDALDPTVRARLVVEAVAGLSAEQADEVAGPAAPPGLAPAPVRFVAEAMPVPPVPTGRIAEVRAARHRRRAGALVAAVAAVGVGAAVLAPTVRDGLTTTPAASPSDVGPPPDADDVIVVQPPEVPVTVVYRRGFDQTRLPVTFTAGGQVHFPPHVDVGDVDTLVAPAVVGVGVVATTDDRLVRHVTPDGRVDSVGALTPGTVPVASTSDATVGWLEGTDNRFLRVYDLAASTTRGYVTVPPDARLVALADGEAYLTSAGGTLVLGQAPRTRSVPGRPVVSLAGGTVLRRADGSRLRVEPADRAAYDVRAQDPQLSDDGRYLLARGLAGTRFGVLEVASGEPVDLPLLRGSYVVDASLDAGVLTVLVRQSGGGIFAGDDTPGAYSPVYDVHTCDLARARCRPAARVLGADDAPRLAR